MDQNPWSSPGAVNVPAPLHQLPDSPEKWLPKFNPDTGTPAEEHINNFMLSVNLKGVTQEDVVARLFPYTLQGSARSWYFSLPSGSITSWNIFQEQFLTKYGDNRSLATLINDLSNLRIESKEPIKEFNSRFNKLLNKIPTTSKPIEQIKSEWYIISLPSNITIFVDRAAKLTLAKNMKEALAIEKCIIALEKKAALEDRKSKKVSFKDDSKKKTPKDPYDMEGLQKFLKTMSNEMVEIKKQVAETSTKRPFRNFKKPESKPPNTISNVDSDPKEEEEDETVLPSKEPKEEETIECHGMWDFILPNSDTENEQEAFPVTTRSKGTPEPVQATSKKRNAGSTTTKEKISTKKAAPIPSQNQPSSSNLPSTSNTLVVIDSMDYSIIEDMKKVKANITMFELRELKHQQKLLLKELNVVPSSPLPNAVLSKAANDSSKPPPSRVEATDAVLIGDRSNYHTPPFLLTYEIYNRNLHNYFIDLGVSSNIMPASVCSKLNIEPQNSAIHIVQLDRTKV